MKGPTAECGENQVGMAKLDSDVQDGSDLVLHALSLPGKCRWTYDFPRRTVVQGKNGVVDMLTNNEEFQKHSLNKTQIEFDSNNENFDSHVLKSF